MTGSPEEGHTEQDEPLAPGPMTGSPEEGLLGFPNLTKGILSRTSLSHPPTYTL